MTYLQKCTFCRPQTLPHCLVAYLTECFACAYSTAVILVLELSEVDKCHCQ